jgi:hypothetical protein
VIATRNPSRIASGWYRSQGQMTLCHWQGSGFDRVLIESRIVPGRCRFRVRPVGRDSWHTVESYAEEAKFERIDR